MLKWGQQVVVDAEKGTEFKSKFKMNNKNLNTYAVNYIKLGTFI